MLNIPEEVKNLYRRNNSSKETWRTFRMRFYDKSIDLLYPAEDLWPSEDLFPVDDTPVYEITGKNFPNEDFSLNQPLCMGQQLVFGQCNSALLEVTVINVDRDLTGMEFTLSVEVGGYEMMLGIYKVYSFEKTADRTKRKIVAYDRMRCFQVDVCDWYNALTFPMTLKAFRDSLCSHIGIQQQDTVLPLDNMEVTKTIDPGQLYGLNVLKAICEINGCFGQMDFMGRLRYVFLSESGLFPAEDLYPSEELFPAEMEGETLTHYNSSKTTFEDFLSASIDRVQIRKEEGDVGAMYPPDKGGKNLYIIQGNFLAYGKGQEELEYIASVAYQNMAHRVYRPCKITGLTSMPWVETGDGIICETGDDRIETYCLERTIKGVQTMKDIIVAQGGAVYKQDFSVAAQIIQLEGKSAVIKKSVEEVSVKLTDLKEYTEAQIKILADEITLEVTRAKDEEARLAASIRIQADQIALEVTRATQEEAKLAASIKIQADQIAMKVSKGEVSSQLSIEPDAINLRTNRLSWQSDYSSMTQDGTLTCRNLRAINGYFSGRLETDVFYTDDDIVQFGDFYVSANGSNTLASNDGTVSIQTAAGGPFGKYASLVLSSQSGTTMLTDHHLETRLVDARQIKGDCMLVGDNWWSDYTLFEALDWLYNRIESLGV